MLQTTCRLPLSDVAQLSTFDRAYAGLEERLSPFYEHRPDQWASYERATAAKAAYFTQAARRRLSHALLAQYDQLPSDTPHKLQALAQIERLLDANCFSVCTAHQPCVATGALYVVYKILAAVALARQLNERYADKYYIPVYWMGSDDHDFEEISQIGLFGKRLAWAGKGGGAVGRLPAATDADLQAFADEYAAILGEKSASAVEIAEYVRTAYSLYPTFGAATRYLLHRLFGQYGLVIVDGDDEQLKAAFLPVMEDDLFTHSSHRLVSASCERIEATGLRAQSYPRPINLFYLSERSRERIVRSDDGGHWQPLQGAQRWTAEQIGSLLLEEPKNFSPNVVLRPLYQEQTLPNVAYIGGGGEVAYWLERKAQFAHFATPFPVLVRRPSVLVVDAAQGERLAKLGISAADLLQQPLEQLIKNYLHRTADIDLSTDEAKERCLAELAAIATRTQALDGGELATFIATQQAALGQMFQKIQERVNRAAKRRQETELQQIQRLHERLLPNGSLQERAENVGSFYALYGRSFFDSLLTAFAEDALGCHFIVLQAVG